MDAMTRLLAWTALILLGAACGSSPAPNRAADAERGDGGNGGDPFVVNCDDVGPTDVPLRLGRAGTLEFTTWNLHNFPATGTTANRVADLITTMDVDLVAVQEVADVASFATLLGALPAYDGITSSDTYDADTYQKTGLLWRKEVFSLVDSIALFGTDGYIFPRPPLQARFDVRRCDGSTRPLVVIDVHLKAGIAVEDGNRRRQAVVQLKNYIDGLVAQGNPDVVALGDYNDTQAVPPADNVFAPFVADPADYTIATQSLDDGVEYTYITYTVFLDQIVVTAPLAQALALGSTRVVHLDELVTGYSYVDVVSDHRPVVSILPR